MSRTILTVAFSVTFMAGTALAGCGSSEETATGDGLGTPTPAVTSVTTEAPRRGLDRYTPPQGECGVTLVCGLGAGPDGPLTP